MKSVFGIIGGLLGVGAVAALVLRQAAQDAHLREVGLATCVTLVAAMASMVPIFLARRSEPVTVFQAAFGGTIIHIFLTLGLGGATYALQSIDRKIFIFLLLGFYWISLLLVALAMIRIFRRAAQHHVETMQVKSNSL